MDPEVIGAELRRMLRLYAAAPKKHRDIYLGMALGLKQALDLSGEGRYARLFIDEGVADLGRGLGSNRGARRVIDMLF